MDFDTGTDGSRQSGSNAPGPVSSHGGFDLGDPVGSFFRTARNVLLSPRRFFQSIARGGDYVGPLVFALVCAVISGLLSGIVVFIIALMSGDVDSALVALIGGVLVVLVRAAISLVVGAGTWHLLVMLLVGSNNAGFEATFRVAAYVSAIQLVTCVATIGIPGAVIALLVSIYGLYVAYFGIQEIHSTTRQRAAAVIALPIFALMFLGVFGAILIPVLLSMS